MIDDKMHYGPEFPVLRWRWLWGIPWQFWANFQKEIGEFVKVHQLEPVAPVMTSQHPSGRSEEPSSAPRPRPLPRPFPGGLRAAHLHWQGELYMLNERQWTDFSRQRVETFQARLAEVRTVGLQQLLELDDTLGPLT